MNTKKESKETRYLILGIVIGVMLTALVSFSLKLNPTKFDTSNNNKPTFDDLPPYVTYSSDTVFHNDTLFTVFSNSSHGVHLSLRYFPVSWKHYHLEKFYGQSQRLHVFSFHLNGKLAHMRLTYPDRDTIIDGQPYYETQNLWMDTNGRIISAHLGRDFKYGWSYPIYDKKETSEEDDDE